jgi:hypothetical protein
MNNNNENILSVDSHNIKYPLIIPTKCTMFIHHIQLLYFSYMFQCYSHYLQGELLSPLLETKYCYEYPCNENQIHPNTANRQSTKKQNTYQLLYIYIVYLLIMGYKYARNM